MPTINYNAIIEAILTASDPQTAVHRFVKREGMVLSCNGKTYNLEEYERIVVVGAGKASGNMALAIEEILGDRIETGLVIVKDGYTARTKRVRIAEAAHPVPDERSPRLVAEMAQILGSMTKRDLVICLISGGGSALMTAPITDRITLEEYKNLTNHLLRCGAAITEINTVRKHLLRLSGGRLAALAAPAEVLCLIVSDIVGSPLSMIASGPTAPDETSPHDARAILERYKLQSIIAPSILETLSSVISETPMPLHRTFSRVHNVIIADNSLAAEAAQKAASEQGFQTFIQSTTLEGEAREFGKQCGAIARSVIAGATAHSPRICLIWSGETTVTVRGSGKGGRNQELALAAAIELYNLRGASLLVLATDGTDGPTDAAGAIVHSKTIEEGRKYGFDATMFLERNDSYSFFDSTQSLLKIGPTNTNVNDVVMLFIEHSSTDVSTH
ncbi:MAG: glycerate kinase [Candidatus Kapabacteria bacterium]|jgi:hydroxypyruvate reductase|nr:glycerate kinase [Candidatus Kapabacteria bacterium]